MISKHDAQHQHDLVRPQPTSNVQQRCTRCAREQADPNAESLWDVLMRLLEADK